jgi:hypothetical protein
MGREEKTEVEGHGWSVGSHRLRLGCEVATVPPSRRSFRDAKGALRTGGPFGKGAPESPGPLHEPGKVKDGEMNSPLQRKGAQG